KKALSVFAQKVARWFFKYTGRCTGVKLVKKGLFILFLAMLIALVACSDKDTEDVSKSDDGKTEEKSDNKSGDKTDNEASEAKAGGDLQYVLNTQPPTIDPVMTTATATRDIARPIFETLVTITSTYEPAPMLAESWEESDDGLTYTFK